MMTGSTRKGRRPALRVAAIVASLATIVALTQTATRPTRAAPASAARPATTTAPNIAIILSDDQRWDTLTTPDGTVAMPNVKSMLQDHGVTFENAYIPVTICCPSRTSILTGNYSHTTGVYLNGNNKYGGWQAFNAHGEESSTIATWLHDAGYETGLIGKYLNGYDASTLYVPPGWDRWFALQGERGGYYNYSVLDQDHLVSYGSNASDYSTYVFGQQAVDFINSVPSDKPLFLYLAPHAPHGPVQAPPDHQTEFADLPPWDVPSSNEADVSDKPQYIQQLPLIPKYGPMFRIDQYRADLGIDDVVGDVVNTLAADGRLGNTMIMYLTDNGLTWNEHRLKNTKYTPYEEPSRIPLVIRYDPLTATPLQDTHPVLNIDLAPTIASVAGVPFPSTEGSDLRPLLDGTATTWRTKFLIEHFRGVAPPYCGVHTASFMYVAYETHEEELYDLSADPYELQNVATDPNYLSVLLRMRRQMAQLCSPPPPGFDFFP